MMPRRSWIGRSLLRAPVIAGTAVRAKDKRRRNGLRMAKRFADEPDEAHLVVRARRRFAGRDCLRSTGPGSRCGDGTNDAGRVVRSIVECRVNSRQPHRAVVAETGFVQ